MVALAWSTPADYGGRSIAGYRIEWRGADGTTWQDAVADTGSADTTHSVTVPSGETSRRFRVSAKNSVGIGNPANVATAFNTPATGAPSVTGPGRADADRLDGRDLRRRRAHGRDLRLPVVPSRRHDRDGDFRGDRDQLHAGGGRCGQAHRGAGGLHRRPGLRRDAGERAGGEGRRRGVARCDRGAGRMAEFERGCKGGGVRDYTTRTTFVATRCGSPHVLAGGAKAGILPTGAHRACAGCARVESHLAKRRERRATARSRSAMGAFS